MVTFGWPPAWVVVGAMPNSRIPLEALALPGATAIADVSRARQMSASRPPRRDRPRLPLDSIASFIVVSPRVRVRSTTATTPRVASAGMALALVMLAMVFVVAVLPPVPRVGHVPARAERGAGAE